MDIRDFKINKPTNSYSIVELRDSIGNLICFAHNSPTMNCQLYCIGGIQQILRYDGVQLKKELFNLIHTEVFKRALLVDIESSYESLLLEVFNKENIISKMPYVSTNGSRMTIFIFKTDKIID